MIPAFIICLFALAAYGIVVTLRVDKQNLYIEDLENEVDWLEEERKRERNMHYEEIRKERATRRFIENFAKEK